MIFESIRGDEVDRFPMVRSILTNPGIYPYMGDDFAPTPSDFKVNDHPSIRYVLVWGYGDRNGRRLFGMFCFYPENEICWWAHVALFRGTPRSLTLQAGREVAEWVWNDTACKRLIASVPACNRAAVRYGTDPRGMSLLPFGINEKSFQKHGKLWDQVLMGRSRPGV